MKPTLVIGATGTVGRQVVSQLVARNMKVRAMTRVPETARFGAQVEVVQGDLTQPATLDRCLEGVESVFLVWTAPQSAVEAALELIAKRARRIVFLSAPLKTPHPFFQQPNAARTLALKIEQLIETSGLEWTFLRPGMFAANSRDFWGSQIRTGDVVRWPYLTAATAPIDERDIGAVAVRVLSQDRHAGMEYVLTGPQSLTQFEQISTIGQAIGRELMIEEISRERALTELFADWPPPVANMLLDAWAAAVGPPAFVTSSVEALTGSPARTFFEWAEDNADAFTTESLTAARR